MTFKDEIKAAVQECIDASKNDLRMNARENLYMRQAAQHYLEQLLERVVDRKDYIACHHCPCGNNIPFTCTSPDRWIAQAEQDNEIE